MTTKNNDELHGKLTRLGQDLQNGTRHDITKDELLCVVVPWKFAVGKPRPALRQHLEANAPRAVIECTLAGISLARDISVSKTKDHVEDDDDEPLNQQIKAAIMAVTQLSGVGPATASLILSLVRPDVFSYMFDEVIDCFLPNRTYTLPVYLQCNAACRQIGLGLSWTPARVAQILWTAARACATKGKLHDYTLVLLSPSLFTENKPKRDRATELPNNGNRQCCKQRRKR